MLNVTLIDNSMKCMDPGQPPGSAGVIGINYTWKIAPCS